MKPFAFGLTGGIASGKSTVSKAFKERGIPIVDADEIARKVVQPGSQALVGIVHAFGDGVLLSDGNMDRVKVGALVFADPEKLATLNRIISPFLRASCQWHIEEQFRAGHPVVCFDAPLLVEKGLQDMYRPVVVVYCSVETQIKRMKLRNGFTEEEARQRLAAQLTTEERSRHADYRISTDNTMDETKVLALGVLDAILRNGEVGDGINIVRVAK